jgi:putative flippase GtrA
MSAPGTRPQRTGKRTGKWTKRTADRGPQRALAAARHLSSPEGGRLGQGIRFAIAGAVVALVYLTTTTLLAQVFGVAFQVALAVGFVLGLCVHFSLQRVFVWIHHEEFALAIHEQAGRYLLVAGVQYGVTAASIAVLPSALNVSSEAVYLVTVAIVSVANFLVFGSRVFHGAPRGPDGVR